MIALPPPRVFRPTWSTVWTLQERDFGALFRSISTFVVIALALVVAGVMLRSNLSYSQNNDGLLVVSNPMSIPFFTIALISTVFLALSSCTAVAREYDQGTLEVLFYGPVDPASFIVAKYLTYTFVYLIMLVIFAAGLVIDSLLTNLRLSPDVVAGVVLSVFTSSAVVAFGVWVSTALQRVRTAVLALLVVIVLLVALQSGDSLLGTIVSASGDNSPLYYLASAIHLLNGAAAWLSPFSYLMRGMAAVASGLDAEFALMLAASIIFTVVFLTAGICTMVWKGVRR